MDATLQELYQKQQKVIQETTERVTLEEYYHSQYDLSVSTGRVLKFSKVPESFIEQVLTSPVMGADISTRLWRQDIDSGFKIRQYLNQMFIEGKPPQYFAEELGKAIGAVQVGKDGKVIGSGKKYEAYRLLYNEASYAANQARLKAYREMGAPYYELTATLDIRTTPICQSLDGCIFGIYTGGDVPAEYRKTGSEYRQAAYSADRVVVGVNYPPFHVNCRTVAVPHYPTTDTARMTRAARDAEDNPITVPADMKYEEWYETYIRKTLVPEKRLVETKIVQTKANKKGESNSIVDVSGKDGIIKTRRWYDEEGRAKKDIDTSDHGNAKHHPMGAHAHDWVWEGEKATRGEQRILSETERKENSDIL